ncbi:MAG: hypothetical protein CM15mP74_08740 [Halieaceae bacterium]|nr:MAG: hypothetical protein CM15mP74_08740 [Halieaceae bacterium]
MVLRISPLRVLDNVSAAARGDIVFVTVPFGAHTPTLESIKDAVQGKVLVDVTGAVGTSARGAGAGFP